MSLHWSNIISAAAASASAVAAGIAWRTSEKANETAEAVARIERARWQAELTPEFRITIERNQGEHASLNVQLVGPLPLGHLDHMSIAILASDDMDHTVRLPHGHPTQEEVDGQVWGPYRFTPGTDGADRNGQMVPAVPLQVGRGRPFAIEKTRPPFWQDGDDREERWREQWRGAPLKLRLTCHRDGFEPWIVPYDIEISGPNVRFM